MYNNNIINLMFWIFFKIQKAVSCAVMATAGPNETAADIREVLNAFIRVIVLIALIHGVQ